MILYTSKPEKEKED